MNDEIGPLFIISVIALSGVWALVADYRAKLIFLKRRKIGAAVIMVISASLVAASFTGFYLVAQQSLFSFFVLSLMTIIGFPAFFISANFKY